MAKFQIELTVSRVDLGAYEGETIDEALDAMAKDWGYDSYDELLSVNGETRETATLAVSEVME
jgi:hypothetical protein